MSPAAPAAPPPRIKTWGLRLLVVAVVCVGLYLSRAPLLRHVAGFLVVDEVAQPGDVVLVLGADRGYERASEWQHEGLVSRVLVLECPPGRLERLGILDNDGARARKALAKGAVPETSLTVLPCAGRGDWHRARALRDWLVQNPAVSVAAVCDRMRSRRTRLLYRSVLGDVASRVHWCGLANPGYDETNWWDHKIGLRACFDGYIGLAHVWVYGENPKGEREWDPDQYEQTLPQKP